MEFLSFLFVSFPLKSLNIFTITILKPLLYELISLGMVIIFLFLNTFSFSFFFLKKYFSREKPLRRRYLKRWGKEGAQEPRQRLWVPREDRRPQLGQLLVERGSDCRGQDQGTAAASSGARATAFPVGAAGVSTGVGRPAGLQPRKLLRLRRAEGRGRDGGEGLSWNVHSWRWPSPA